MTPFSTTRVSRRAFSLVEVLLAIFILGIGMIMVASIFPVGANWTRQATEETVGQQISENAISVLQQYYGPGGACAGDLLPNFSTNAVLNNTTDTPFQLQAMPGFLKIPLNQRSYQFGNNSPFPAGNPLACTYFWTALCRLSPAHKINNAPTNNVFPSGSYKYDVYILVFRKGDTSHAFDSTKAPFPTLYGSSMTEISGMRNLNTNPPAGQFNEVIVPYVVRGTFKPGVYNAGTTPVITGALPPVGAIGIGQFSGTVFRQGFDTLTSTALPRPSIGGMPGPGPYEGVIWAPGPNLIGGLSTTTEIDKSPLIYVYQTTLTM